jgi:iron complex outermembrane receptor protein
LLIKTLNTKQILKGGVCLLIFFIRAYSLQAQTKDTTKIAVIRSKNGNDKITRQEFDAEQRQFTVAGDAVSLLEMNSNAYVRNYGLSNLSTLSIRGSSVAQTSVLWNDIPIQNTILGLTDLSTVPNFFFDKMALYSSGFNELGKVQTVGGRLELNNQSKFSEQNKISAGVLLGYESFRNSIVGLKGEFSSQKWNAQLKYYNRQGNNQYVFENSYLKREDTIRHAFAIQEQLMAQVAWRPNLHHRLKFSFWKINSFREIAPLAYEDNPTRSERNDVSRFGLKHRYVNSKFRWKTSLGLTTDSFFYEDKQALLESAARVITIPLNTNASFDINDKSDVGFALSQQTSFLKRNATQFNQSQGSAQLYYNHLNIWRGLAVNLFAQQGYTDRRDNPFTYGLKLIQPIKTDHRLYLSFNTNYRLPTLNELYYFPGGNENLLPEKSKNVEVGGQASLRKNNFHFTSKLSLYSRWVDDWILWSGSAIFFPDNIAEVWSRGLESQSSFSYRKKNLLLRNDFLIHLNRSTSQRAYFMNDNSIGRQIPYAPRTTWRNNFYASYKKMSAQVNLSYTGYRFVTRDETRFVNPFTLVNLYASYKLTIHKKWDAECQLRANNLLNESYESVRGRIMPGRNWAITLLTDLQF